MGSRLIHPPCSSAFHQLSQAGSGKAEGWDVLWRVWWLVQGLQSRQVRLLAWETGPQPWEALALRGQPINHLVCEVLRVVWLHRPLFSPDSSKTPGSQGPCLAGGPGTLGLLGAGNRCPHSLKAQGEGPRARLPQPVLSHLILVPALLLPSSATPKPGPYLTRASRLDRSTGRRWWRPFP